MHIEHKADMKYPYHMKNDLGEQWIIEITIRRDLEIQLKAI